MTFSLLSAAGDIDTLATTRLSVIVVGANPALSKSFYKSTYIDEAMKPDCYSLNGEHLIKIAMTLSQTCVHCVHRMHGVLVLHLLVSVWLR